MKGCLNRTVIALVLMVIILALCSSCYKHSRVFTKLCPTGDCEAVYDVVYKNQPILPNANGHYEIEWDGLNYFQLKGQLSELHPDYTINKIPSIDCRFDSDYWVLFDTIRFSTPMYSYLGWFNTTAMNRPISMGNHTYTMADLIDLHPPYNIAGYQVPKHFCYDCPYAPTIVGTHSRYTYYPTQNFLLDDEMIGDTINMFIETVFNTEGGIYYNSSDDIVPTEIVEQTIKIIVI